MVRYYDDDGVFDAPLDQVWRLIEAHSDEDIPRIHPAFRSARTLSESSGVTEREIEMTLPNGSVEAMRLRLTALPPVSLTIEYLSGPLAGSWVANVYVAERKKTRVVCTGEFAMPGATDAETIDMVTQMLDARFEEDAHYLSKISHAPTP